MRMHRRQVLSLLSAAPILGLGSPARAATAPVKIGVLFPLTGNSATAGQECKAAVEVGAEIVNNAHPELAGLALGATAGLPNLGGAKIEPIFVDHRGDPALAQTEALRLIVQQHATALIGSYQSSTAMTATAVAERYGVPFVVSDSVAANITGRGFKWTFRVTPIAPSFGDTYMRFLKQVKQAGQSVNSVAIVSENTDYGTSVGDAIAQAAKSYDIPLALRIRYAANSPDLTSAVLQLKSANPTVGIFVSYTADAILYMKTMKTLDYTPPMIIGDSAGFSDPSFIKSVGDMAQGLLNRSAWSLGKPGSLSAGVNAVFKAKTGYDVDDTSGRVLEAFFVLADAINAAGSTEPAKVQAALRATNLKPDQLVVGYRGVRFDETGQNILAATYITQMQGRNYATVWPDTAAEAKLEWPMRAWRS
jgi:branched-chain amino acid transport system substrate-binding protein